MSRHPGSCLWQWTGCTRRAVTISSSSASGPSPACQACADHNWARASEVRHHFAPGMGRSACKKQPLFPETEIRILGNGRRVCAEGTRPDRQRPPWALSDWRRVDCPGCKRARTARPPAKKRGRGWPRYTHFASPGAARSKCGSVSSKVFIGLNFCWTNVNCPRCLAMRERPRHRRDVPPGPTARVHFVRQDNVRSDCGMSSGRLPLQRDWSIVNCRRCLASKPLEDLRLQVAMREDVERAEEIVGSLSYSVEQSALLHLFNENLSTRGEELQPAQKAA